MRACSLATTLGSICPVLFLFWSWFFERCIFGISFSNFERMRD